MQSFILITKPINKFTVKVVFYAADKVSVFYCQKICVDIEYMDVWLTTLKFEVFTIHPGVYLHFKA